jgi:hypothetical protein
MYSAPLPNMARRLQYPRTGGLAMADKYKQIRITCFENPRHTVAGSVWGRMTYGEWCRREVERLAASGRKATVRANS